MGILSPLTLAAALGFAGQSGQAPSDPVEMIKWSMDKCASLKYWHAYCFHAWSENERDPHAQTDQEKRFIDFAAPNRIKITATNYSDGATRFTLVSDGKKAVIYGDKGATAEEKVAPAKFSDLQDIGSSRLTALTPLPLFFLGRGGFDKLVDTCQGRVTFEDRWSNKVDGQHLRWVKFHGTGDYGQIEAGIDVDSGQVHSLRWDVAPMLKRIEAQIKATKALMQAQIAKMDPGKERTEEEAALKSIDSALKNPAAEVFSEGYPTNMMSFKPIDASTFDTGLPAGVSLAPLPTGLAQPNTPVPLGTPAPDFTVTRLDGVKVKLSSLRGHPVLIDFWATWCGPCVASLPHTQELFTKGKAAGLQVLAISDEQASVVSKFVKANKYTFPTYLDPGATAAAAFKVEAIPATVVLDAKGNLVAYIVGAGQDAAIKAALAKVGVRFE